MMHGRQTPLGKCSPSRSGVPHGSGRGTTPPQGRPASPFVNSSQHVHGSSATLDASGPKERRYLTLSRAGAPAADLADLEARIGHPLPVGYLRFLELSDGWPPLAAMGSPMWRAREVGPLADFHPHIAGRRVTDLTGAAEAPSYDGPAIIVSPSLVQVGGDQNDRVRDIYALDPTAIGDDGEWEAWLLSAAGQSVVRFHGIWDLIQYVCRLDREISRGLAGQH